MSTTIIDADELPDPREAWNGKGFVRSCLSISSTVPNSEKQPVKRESVTARR
jgi:hypothetical protein